MAVAERAIVSVAMRAAPSRAADRGCYFRQVHVGCAPENACEVAGVVVHDWAKTTIVAADLHTVVATGKRGSVDLALLAREIVAVYALRERKSMREQLRRYSHD